MITGTSPAAAVFSGARVYNSANISINNNTRTVVTFDSERYDTDAYHSTSSNTSRLTIPSDGYYEVGCNINFDSSALGAARYAQITRNRGGTKTIIANVNGTPLANEVVLEVMTQDAFLAGDIVEVQVFQDSGGALNLLRHATFDFGGGDTMAANAGIEFWIRRLGA